MSTVGIVGYSGLLRRLNISTLSVLRELRYLQANGGEKFDRQGEASDLVAFLGREGGVKGDSAEAESEYHRFHANSQSPGSNFTELVELADEDEQAVGLLERLARDPSMEGVDAAELSRLEVLLRKLAERVDGALYEGYEQNEEEN